MDEQFWKYLIAGTISSLVAVFIFEQLKARKRPCGCKDENGSGQTTGNYRPGKYPTPSKTMSMTPPVKSRA